MKLSKCNLRAVCSAVLALGSVAGLSSCAVNLNPVKAPVVPPSGAIFTLYKAPLDVDFSDDNGTPTEVRGLEMGDARAHYIYIPQVGIDFAWGDASIEAASLDGGLSTVEYADYELLSVLGIYVSTTIEAHGKR